jgi:hypothetical protein
MILEPKRKGMSKCIADKQIKTFKTAFRGVVAKTLLSQDAHLFKPAKSQRNNFSGLAITGDVAAVACNVHVTEEEKLHIAESLIKLSRTISNKDCKSYMNDDKKLLAVKLKLNGKASWDSQLDRLHNSSLSCDVHDWSISGTPTEEVPPAFFKCPGCNHQEPNTSKPFRHGDLDKKQQCNACKKSTSVNQWKCCCAKYWHRCHLHRHCWPAVQHSGRLTRPRVSTSQVCTKRPRTCGTQAFEVMLTEDESRAKRELQEIEEWQVQFSFYLGQPKIR